MPFNFCILMFSLNAIHKDMSPTNMKTPRPSPTLLSFLHISHCIITYFCIIIFIFIFNPSCFYFIHLFPKKPCPGNLGTNLSKIKHGHIKRYTWGIPPSLHFYSSLFPFFSFSFFIFFSLLRLPSPQLCSPLSEAITYAAMGSSVRVTEAVVITPSASTPSAVLQLSALDSQLFLRFTIEYLLLFRSRPGLDLVATSAALKSTLARALVPYYPLAGRVRSRHDGSCLEVVCRAQGALFIEAFSDRFLLGDLQDKAPKTVTQWRKFLSFPVADVLKGSPPLVVQLTWLRDGSAAVGIGINHCVCDGIGSADFLNHFADLARSSVLAADPIKPTLKPVWDRNLLNSPSTKTAQATNPAILHEFNRVPDLCGFMTRVSSDLKPTSITFDKTRLDQLKSIALDTSRLEESSFTSFEVLAAHVWRSWARALNFPANQTLKLLFSINVRNRLKPSLPDGYYGNALVLGCAQSSAKELEEKGVGYGSGLVKRAKEIVDGEYVRKVIELVSESRACPDSVGVLILSQWSRLGLERVDFGMGEPMSVGPICCDRYCLFLPVKDQSDAVKVMVAVPTSAVDDYIYSLASH